MRSSSFMDNRLYWNTHEYAVARSSTFPLYLSFSQSINFDFISKIVSHVWLYVIHGHHDRLGWFTEKKEKCRDICGKVERIISIGKIDLFHTIWHYIKLQKYNFIGILSYINLYCRFVQWVSREIIRVIAIKEKL